MTASMTHDTTTTTTNPREFLTPWESVSNRLGRLLGRAATQLWRASARVVGEEPEDIGQMIDDAFEAGHRAGVQRGLRDAERGMLKTFTELDEETNR